MAVGLALQGALSNLAGGILLMVLRPFKVGDYVDAGGGVIVYHAADNAFPEWVSLYVGSKGYKGPTNLKAMALADESSSDDLEMDTHLYDMRSIDDPLVRRLIEAADADAKAQASQEGE